MFLHAFSEKKNLLSKILLVSEMSRRRLQDRSCGLLEDIFCITTFCLSGRLEDIFKKSWKTTNCYAEGIFKMSSRPVLETSSRHVLKIPSRHNLKMSSRPKKYLLRRNIYLYLTNLTLHLTNL